jgi:hypothetical protein
MVADKNIIKRVANYHKVMLEKDFEQFIYQEYGQDPFPYEYSEEDLYMQISKLVGDYKKGGFEFKLLTPMEKLIQENCIIKDICIENIREVNHLNEQLDELKEVIINNGLSVPNDEIDF